MATCNPLLPVESDAPRVLVLFVTPFALPLLPATDTPSISVGALCGTEPVVVGGKHALVELTNVIPSCQGTLGTSFENCSESEKMSINKKQKPHVIKPTMFTTKTINNVSSSVVVDIFIIIVIRKITDTNLKYVKQKKMFHPEFVLVHSNQLLHMMRQKS